MNTECYVFEDIILLYSPFSTEERNGHALYKPNFENKLVTRSKLIHNILCQMSHSLKTHY